MHRKLITMAAALVIARPTSAPAEPQSLSTKSKRLQLTAPDGPGGGWQIDMAKIEDSHLDRVKLTIDNGSLAYLDVYLEAAPNGGTYDGTKGTKLGRVSAATKELHSILDALTNGGTFIENEGKSQTFTLNLVTGGDRHILSVYALGNGSNPTDAGDKSRCQAISTYQIAHLLFTRVILPILDQVIDAKFRGKSVERMVDRIVAHYGVELVDLWTQSQSGDPVKTVELVSGLAKSILSDEEMQREMINELAVSAAKKAALKKLFAKALAANEIGIDAANLASSLTYFVLKSVISPCRWDITVEVVSTAGTVPRCDAMPAANSKQAEKFKTAALACAMIKEAKLGTDAHKKLLNGCLYGERPGANPLLTDPSLCLPLLVADHVARPDPQRLSLRTYLATKQKVLTKRPYTDDPRYYGDVIQLDALLRHYAKRTGGL